MANDQGSQRGGSGNFAQDRDKASEAGRKGGQQSHGGQATGHQPQSTQQGAGQRGGAGNFAEDRERASQAGQKGGEHSHGKPSR